LLKDSILNTKTIVDRSASELISQLI